MNLDKCFETIRERFKKQDYIDFCEERFARRSECFDDDEALELAIKDTEEYYKKRWL